MFKEVKEPYQPCVLEERVARFWQETDAYRRAREARRGGPRFSFVDGPPYTTGRIHLGTAMNKAFKDVILRYRAMRGHDVADRPGWDMHGLPIEVKVEGLLGFTSKKDIETFGAERFIEECRRFAISNMEEMAAQFRRLGVWMDWEHPYRTLDADYMDAAWWTVKRAWERGLLERGHRVVNWCPRCETALAEAEVDYAERRDASIYVKFPLTEPDLHGAALVIWTTTPWTLPANLAAAVDPSADYALVRARKDGAEERLVLARQLVDSVLALGGYASWEVERAFPGSEMVGWRYESPLADTVPRQRQAEHHVLGADFVTMENTGIVHIAPGHGEDDFHLGQQEGLEPFSPVGDSGRFTEAAGAYEGMGVWEANEVIMEDLGRRGLLLASGHVDHRYGHCPRCKSPILFRATDQWFIAVSRLRDEMLRVVERVKWHPDWAGAARFHDWIAGARDWCVSRQRYWGIPIPVWVCDACGELRVVGGRRELEELAGCKLSDLHRPSVDQLRLPCSCSSSMRRVPDIFDVWFDSAVASWATVGFPVRIGADELHRQWPADLIIEGHDQTRGWFYSQLGASLASHGEAPYREVIVHGFALDAERRAMHKSLGNVIDPLDVVNGGVGAENVDSGGEAQELSDRSAGARVGGADALRLFVISQKPPWDDLVFTWDGVVNAYRTLNVFWNLHRFPLPYMALDDFQPNDVAYEDVRAHLRAEDRWLLSRAQGMVERVGMAMDDAELHVAARALVDFVVEDFSRWYVQLARRRTWVEREDPDKLAAYFTIYEALATAIKVAAPFTPFIAEQMYQHVVVAADPEAPPSVHMADWPVARPEWRDERLEIQMSLARQTVEAALHARHRVGLGVRWPIARLVVLTEDVVLKDAIKSLESVILEQVNAKSLEIYTGYDDLPDAQWKIVEVIGEIGPKFKGRTMKVIDALKLLDPLFVRDAITTGRPIEVVVDGEKVKVPIAMFGVMPTPPGYLVDSKFEKGLVMVDVRLDGALRAEGVVREVVRHVQDLRRELDLELNQRIDVYVQAPADVLAILEASHGFIAEEVRARGVHLGEPGPEGASRREVPLDAGEPVTVAVVVP